MCECAQYIIHKCMEVELDSLISDCENTCCVNGSLF